MLSHQIETITTDDNIFYCDHHHDCLDKIKLPALAADMLRADNTLILLLGNHKFDKPTEVKAKGKGWKVCKVKKHTPTP